MKSENWIIEADVQRIIEIMQPRVNSEDIGRILDAYKVASAAHSGQKRRSGEPFIMHPVSVALIAAEELELDANTVCAAFLHDVVEDSELYTLEDIRERFGDDVAFLVDTVTKKGDEGGQISNFRQMVSSVGYDIRALLLKLSDRLHNMRTLDSMPLNKQMKIAGETDFFYAPLAGRLGLFFVKSELENLSFKFRCLRDYEMMAARLKEDRERTDSSLTSFIGNIEELLSGNGVKFRIEVRYRQPYSIWRDMNANGCDFHHVGFKHYIRVIYQPMKNWNLTSSTEKDTALFIYSILSSHFNEKSGSVTNFIDHPKDNGYQSLHVRLLNPCGVWEELHIASERMHRNSKLGCVVERGESWLERFRLVLRDIAESGDGYLFMDDLNASLYNEDIIAFTPRGKAVILPKGATALDFAFEVHTDVGMHAQYARINGVLNPIGTELKRGDCVIIGTDDKILPDAEWFRFVNTYKAKRFLRDWFRKKSTAPYRRCSCCNPIPGEEVIGFKGAGDEIILHTRHCPEAIKLASEKGDAIVTLSFEPDPEILYPVRIRILAVDRQNLLSEILKSITERNLSMSHLESSCLMSIVTCLIDFAVHSSDELLSVLGSISVIRNVEEVEEIGREC